jgi:hypothetical protein
MGTRLVNQISVGAKGRSNLELDITAAGPEAALPSTPDLEVYLEDSDCITVVSDQLSEIKDKDGDFTFSQATASLRPDYDGTVLSPNGKVGAYFENSRVELPTSASNQLIDSTNGQTIAAVVADMPPNVTFFSKLDSETGGVISSEVGFDLDTVGSPSFEACRDGNGIRCEGSGVGSKYARKIGAYNGPFEDFAVQFDWKADYDWNDDFTSYGPYGENEFFCIWPFGSGNDYIRGYRLQSGANFRWVIVVRNGGSTYAGYEFNTTTTFSAGDILNVGFSLEPSAGNDQKIKCWVNNVPQTHFQSPNDSDWTGKFTSTPYDFALARHPVLSYTEAYGVIDNFKIWDYLKTDFSDYGTFDVYDSAIVGKWHTVNDERRYVLGMRGYSVASDAAVYDSDETAVIASPGATCAIVVSRWKPGEGTAVWTDNVLAGTATSPAASLSGTVDEQVKIGARSDNSYSLQPGKIWALLIWKTGQFTDQQIENIYLYLQERYIT